MNLTIVKHHSEQLALRQQHFTTALAHGDAEDAAQVIDELVAGQSSLLEIYLQVIAPALVSIGDSWCSGEIGVGDEHLATQIVVQQMDRLRSLFVAPEPRSPYRVLVACFSAGLPSSPMRFGRIGKKLFGRSLPFMS